MVRGKKATKKLQKLFELGRERMGIADLRPGQPESLDYILKKKDVLAVMPTGSGKSLLYQLPSLALPGLTVVISPLIALIKDQLDKMNALGVAVCRADSTLTVKQKREMEALVAAPGGKLLFTTPERIAVPEFRELLKHSADKVGVSLFVVDEAHCVSQWGHDFRPSYLSIRKALEDLGRPPVLATTATAPPHVREDILHQLGMPDAKIVTTTFDRPNLHYEVIAVPGDDEKHNTLITLLKKLPRPGIVYCATVKMVESLYEAVGRHRIPVTKYHGRLTKKIRDEQQQKFMAPRSRNVMLATNAFGLGVDKADIRYVLHYHVPGSLEAYAQEAGRGGRDGKPARCVLLFSPDDVAIQEYFLSGTYPTRRQVRSVYRTLEAFADATEQEAKPTIANIALSAKVSNARTRTVLSLLKDEKFVVEKRGGRFFLADPPPDQALLREKARQYEARRIADRQRLDALLEYVGAPGCRNQVILSYLGEEDPPECGRCDNCLRSKEAALAASRQALSLEEVVKRELYDDEEEEPKPRKLARHRVVRIDEPKPDEAAAEAEEPEEDYAWEEVDDAENYDPENYEYEEVEVEEIDRTAAAIAEEGIDLSDTEITILARKKLPKQPKSKRATEEPRPKRRRRRRRRRRKKSAMPPKSAFTSPVLSNNAPETEATDTRAQAPAHASNGPLVEYVRGPMRINMTPVASATPNDQAPKGRKSKKRRRRRKAGGGGANGEAQVNPQARANSRGSQQTAQAPAGQAGDASPPTGKKKRRRRRRKRGGGQRAGQVAAQEGPITFFSMEPSNGSSKNNSASANTGKKRRRRRRRRGRGGRGRSTDTSAKSETAPQADG